ncbi:MAG: VWA domain-containing protein [Planctomycetes bacterium]|nr:VWA domain-containing protein [Planctomycetota bacterium]
MIRGSWFVLFVCVLLVGGSLTPSVGDEREVLKRPLDLPAPGQGNDEEDEDAPESIVFYGVPYEGDAFFWCLDKSCSMVGSPLETLKQQVTESINSLSHRAHIGIVAFSTNVIPWRTYPSRASAANKSAANTWIQTLEAAGGTIIAPAGVQTLAICHQSPKSKKTVIVVGDGRPADESSALTNITTANYEPVPINTILIQDTEGVAFMESLAAQNQGTFLFLP